MLNNVDSLNKHHADQLAVNADGRYDGRRFSVRATTHPKNIRNALYDNFW